MTQAKLTGEKAENHSSPFAEAEETSEPETRDAEAGQETLARFAAEANHQTLDSFTDE